MHSWCGAYLLFALSGLRPVVGRPVRSEMCASPPDSDRLQFAFNRNATTPELRDGAELTY